MFRTVIISWFILKALIVISCFILMALNVISWCMIVASIIVPRFIFIISIYLPLPLLIVLLIIRSPLSLLLLIPSNLLWISVMISLSSASTPWVRTWNMLKVIKMTFHALDWQHIDLSWLYQHLELFTIVYISLKSIFYYEFFFL